MALLNGYHVPIPSLSFPCTTVSHNLFFIWLAVCAGTRLEENNIDWGGKKWMGKNLALLTCRLPCSTLYRLVPLRLFGPRCFITKIWVLLHFKVEFMFVICLNFLELLFLLYLQTLCSHWFICPSLCQWVTLTPWAQRSNLTLTFKNP